MLTADRMDTAYGRLIKKSSELHKEKRLEVTDVMKCCIQGNEALGLSVGL